jgi:predicted RNase H-like nuclease (RuvC/YqgF family)
MTSIVERLRRGEACINDPCRTMEARSGCCCATAADEIERLEREVKALHETIGEIDRQHKDEIERLEREVARLQEALRLKPDIVMQHKDIRS